MQYPLDEAVYKNVSIYNEYFTTKRGKFTLLLTSGNIDHHLDFLCQWSIDFRIYIENGYTYVVAPVLR